VQLDGLGKLKKYPMTSLGFKPTIIQLALSNVMLNFMALK
jgi:hypothetical protein